MIGLAGLKGLLKKVEKLIEQTIRVESKLFGYGTTYREHKALLELQKVRKHLEYVRFHLVNEITLRKRASKNENSNL